MHSIITWYGLRASFNRRPEEKAVVVTNRHGVLIRHEKVNQAHALNTFLRRSPLPLRRCIRSSSVIVSNLCDEHDTSYDASSQRNGDRRSRTEKGCDDMATFPGCTRVNKNYASFGYSFSVRLLWSPVKRRAQSVPVVADKRNAAMTGKFSSADRLSVPNPIISQRFPCPLTFGTFEFRLFGFVSDFDIRASNLFRISAPDRAYRAWS